MSDPESTQSFPYEYVQKLREEAAGYRTELRTAQAALNFYINRYPLGDLEKFSPTRWAMARAMAGPFDEYKLRTIAPYEKAFYEKAQGDYVSGIDGGFLAPEVWTSGWFDLLRNFTVLDQLPIVRLAVDARVAHLPKVMNDVTISYPAENNAPSATAYKFGQLTYTARKSMALMNVSNELIRDAANVADDLFRRSTAQAIAVDRDTQLILGTGNSGGPTGIVQSAINGTISIYYPGSSATTDLATSPASHTPSFLHVSSLRSKVDALNGNTTVTAGQARCSGIIAHSRFLKTVHTLSGAAGPWTDAQGRPLWMAGLNGGIGNNTSPGRGDGEQGGGALLGVPWALTNLLPTNSTQGGGSTDSFMIAGMWERYVLFECMAPTYDATMLSGTSSVGYQADQTQIRMVYRYDGQPVQPEAFAVMAGCSQ